MDLYHSHLYAEHIMLSIRKWPWGGVWNQPNTAPRPSFFLRGRAETGDQREPESHAERRVRLDAKAASPGAWGGPNQRFGMSKRIFRNIAGPISPCFCMAKRYSTIQKICRRGGRGFRTSKRNFPALIFSFAPLTRFRQESGAPTLSVDAPLGGLNSILS